MKKHIFPLNSKKNMPMNTIYLMWCNDGHTSLSMILISVMLGESKIKKSPLTLT